ncbi:chitosanase [Arhodomonas sp. SL1]|uniref:chitosanase n=1 Tax=Arhodomonas sp. SL1 TaxID=3425691 RepID=UPI003F882200
MITPLQKAAAQAVVNVFETGRARGDYGRVTVLPGDTGHLTYGRAQTTLASGNLYLLIRNYCEAAGAAHAPSLRPYLERLEACDRALDGDIELHRVLEAAGTDPVMRETQDAFFDRVYWMPAVRAAESMSVESALGHAVVYDSRIHGSWGHIRRRTEAQHGSPETVGERNWLQAYLQVRRDWLADHNNRLLRRTVYRMDSLQSLCEDGRWDLALPFTVRGVRLDEMVLTASDPVRVSAEEVEVRLVALRRPFLRGEDVRGVQEALAATGFGIAADGIFGPATEQAVIAFQAREGLTVDGVVGPATRAALGTA